MSHAFNEAFEFAQTVAFNDMWYKPDPLTWRLSMVDGPDSVQCEPGVTKRVTDNDGRKTLVIGTPLGNIMVYEKKPSASPVKLGFIFPPKVEELLKPIWLKNLNGQTENGIVTIVGDKNTPNLGFRLQDIFGARLEVMLDKSARSYEARA